jgi:hypothetical protein
MQIVCDDRPYLPLKVDNTGAIAIAQANGPTRRRSIWIRHHYLQELFGSNTIRMQQVPTTMQHADAFYQSRWATQV